MADRSCHLQALAHAAVARALSRGQLTRQECEVCGQEGQAHHDSYYPDKWLKVRWLCRARHRDWHDKNEPEWPTIYEFHPSDRPPAAAQADHFPRGSGRHAGHGTST
jgi:hypothetical protein